MLHELQINLVYPWVFYNEYIILLIILYSYVQFIHVDQYMYIYSIHICVHTYMHIHMYVCSINSLINITRNAVEMD